VIPLVLVCAAPRTGSNHLCRVLSGFECLKVRTEVFARDVAFTVDEHDIAALERITGCIIPRDPSSPTVTQLIYEEPGAMLAALAEARGSEHKALSVKLFGYHLPRAWTRELFRMGAIPVVVKRRKIDSYASKLKAQKIQRWVNADTTLLQVRADVRDYEYWLHRHAQWYDHVAEEAIDPIHLTYEGDIDQPTPELVDKLTQTLGERVDLGPWRSVKALTKQDRNTSPEAKIANWDEFVDQLRERGLYEDAWEYF